jgi:hypothetical protein
MAVYQFGLNLFFIAIIKKSCELMDFSVLKLDSCYDLDHKHYSYLMPRLSLARSAHLVTLKRKTMFFSEQLNSLPLHMLKQKKPKTKDT